MNQILEADTMWLEYNDRKILQSIYLKIETGKITGLLGRNGTGKSSLLKMIFGTLRGQSQSVRVNGKYFSHPYLERDLIRYLPQTTFVPPGLKVEALCTVYDVRFTQLTSYFSNLEECRKEKIRDLSGGKIRLIETLLILLSPVSFVLLDEPFTHLDPTLIEQLLVVIKEQRNNKGIVVSDHLYQNVLDISDELYLIAPGGKSIHLGKPLEELKFYGYLN